MNSFKKLSFLLITYAIKTSLKSYQGYNNNTACIPKS